MVVVHDLGRPFRLRQRLSQVSGLRTGLAYGLPLPEDGFSEGEPRANLPQLR